MLGLEPTDEALALLVVLAHSLAQLLGLLGPQLDVDGVADVAAHGGVGMLVLPVYLVEGFDLSLLGAGIYEVLLVVLSFSDFFGEGLNMMVNLSALVSVAPA